MTVPENPIGGWIERDLNGFQSIRYVNGYVDILLLYDVSFAVQDVCAHQLQMNLLTWCNISALLSSSDKMCSLTAHA